MSWKQLEEVIKNRPSHGWIRDNLDKAEEIDWGFIKIEKAFVAFKKQNICISRKQLEDIIAWEGKPLKPEWKEQIKGQKKLARELLDSK